MFKFPNLPRTNELKYLGLLLSPVMVTNLATPVPENIPTPNAAKSSLNNHTMALDGVNN